MATGRTGGTLAAREVEIAVARGRVWTSLGAALLRVVLGPLLEYVSCRRIEVTVRTDGVFQVDVAILAAVDVDQRHRRRGARGAVESAGEGAGDRCHGGKPIGEGTGELMHEHGAVAHARREDPIGVDAVAVVGRGEPCEAKHVVVVLQLFVAEAGANDLARLGRARGSTHAEPSPVAVRVLEALFAVVLPADAFSGATDDRLSVAAVDVEVSGINDDGL